MSRARYAQNLLVRARSATRAELGNVNVPDDENVHLKAALDALKSGDTEKAISLLEALLGPAAPAEGDAPQTEPEEDGPAAARSRIAQQISAAMGALMVGPSPIEMPQYRSRVSR